MGLLIVLFVALRSCQDVILDNVTLEQGNVAKNEALKENVFMMVVCVQLRIPLFVIGKPGSSKSLAKTIVQEAMRGRDSTNPFFKQLKQSQMTSFQCSPLSTAEGVETVFRQCSKKQKDTNFDQFVSVAVFDEVGLAEDSPLFPLKALHGFLEQGCPIQDEPLERYHKVAFVGISNWSLDPAKMNRGIFVTRLVPSNEELIKTAR
jgi:E3 ubiquitin-protein ligase RNF213